VLLRVAGQSPSRVRENYALGDIRDQTHSLTFDLVFLYEREAAAPVFKTSTASFCFSVSGSIAARVRDLYPENKLGIQHSTSTTRRASDH